MTKITIEVSDEDSTLLDKYALQLAKEAFNVLDGKGSGTVSTDQFKQHLYEIVGRQLVYKILQLVLKYGTENFPDDK